MVREYCCNALDAHTEAGQTRPFEVRLPNEQSPVWSLRDYGPGLTDELVIRVYTEYLNSTKDHSDEMIGGFGLGSKAGFAYTDQWTIVSYYNGTKTTWQAFKDATNEPDAVVVDKVATDEPNGIEIIIPVLPADIEAFERETEKHLKWFPQGSVEIFGEGIVEAKTAPINTPNLLFWPAVNANYHARRANPPRVMMGPVVYDIPQSFYENSEIKPDDFAGIIFKFGIGELALNPGRETISLDRETAEKLKAKFGVALRDIRNDIQAQVDTFQSRFDASRYLGEFKHLHIWSHLQNGFTYQGKAISTYERLWGRDPGEYILIGERGGPARRAQGEGTQQGFTPHGLKAIFIEADVTDLVVSRLNHNQKRLLSIHPEPQRYYKPEVYVLCPEHIAELGIEPVCRLSELEPTPRVGKRKSGQTQIYVYSRRGYHGTWDQDFASNLGARPCAYVPMIGSEIDYDKIGVDDERLTQMMTFLVNMGQKVIGLPKKAQSDLADDGHLMVPAFLEKMARDILDLPDFRDRLKNLEAMWKVCTPRTLFFADFSPTAKRIYEEMAQMPRLDSGQRDVIRTARGFGLVKFRDVNPNTHPLVKQLRSFERRNEPLKLIELMYSERVNPTDEKFADVVRKLTKD